MPTTTPWNIVGDPNHHSHSGCAEGRDFKPTDYRPGTGGKPLCPECAHLIEQSNENAETLARQKRNGR